MYEWRELKLAFDAFNYGNGYAIHVSIMRQSVFCGVDADVIDADDEAAQLTLFVTKNSFPFLFCTMQFFLFFTKLRFMLV